MSKFIALRKRPRSMMLGLESFSMPDRRSALVADAGTSERTMLLESAGLKERTPAPPTAAEPDPEHGYQRLGHLGAYVVDTEQESQAEAAQEILQDEYEIVPNIELALPGTMLAGRVLQRRNQRKPYWPESSGVAAAHAQGIIGQGVLVGILDTGCDADHLEMRQRQIDFRYVPTTNPAVGAMRNIRGFDPHGHGTHVCGILAGKNVGVAPGIDLMVASVIESESLKTSLERIVVALDWMISQFQEEENLEKPLIVSMSLGFLPEWIQGPSLQPALAGMRLLIDNLVTDFDVLPVVAIGNDRAGRMRAPAYFRDVLSVGAVDFDLQPALFSGGGISPDTGQTEPNLSGYGVDIVSCVERDARNWSWYSPMRGTSMATPYLAGIAALTAAANPGLQGMALRDRLVQQAMPLPAPPDRAGAGLARFT
jgi:subtilisin family serine protease